MRASARWAPRGLAAIRAARPSQLECLRVREASPRDSLPSDTSHGVRSMLAPGRETSSASRTSFTCSAQSPASTSSLDGYTGLWQSRTTRCDATTQRPPMPASWHAAFSTVAALRLRRRREWQRAAWRRALLGQRGRCGHPRAPLSCNEATALQESRSRREVIPGTCRAYRISRIWYKRIVYAPCRPDRLLISALCPCSPRPTHEP